MLDKQSDDVLEEVASEIPLSMICEEQKGMILDRIRRCCEFGATWVAVEQDNQVVGVLLAEPNKNERFLNNNQAIDLSYGGVKKAYREQDIFQTLVRKTQDKRVTLTATVKHANKSNMVGRLEKLGFTKLRIYELLRADVGLAIPLNHRATKPPCWEYGVGCRLVVW